MSEAPSGGCTVPPLGAKLPGGVPATVLITMRAEQLQAGIGLASTSFVQQPRVDRGPADSDRTAIALDRAHSTGSILSYGPPAPGSSDSRPSR
jgi:hypothetical protein